MSIRARATIATSFAALLLVGLCFWLHSFTGGSTARNDVQACAQSSAEAGGSSSFRIAQGPQELRDGDFSAECMTFADTSLTLQERRAEIRKLALKGDRRSVKLLMAIGDAPIYVASSAVEALGRAEVPECREESAKYLRSKLTSKDSRLVTAAIRALVHAEKERAVPELVRLIRNNRRRPDGQEEAIRTSAVEGLQDLAVSESLPVLREELERVPKGTESMEYGSVLLAALGAIGSPEARRAAKEYARALAVKMPGDPMARSYYQKKIAEAREVAGLDG